MRSRQMRVCWVGEGSRDWEGSVGQSPREGILRKLSVMHVCVCALEGGTKGGIETEGMKEGEGEGGRAWCMHAAGQWGGSRSAERCRCRWLLRGF